MINDLLSCTANRGSSTEDPTFQLNMQLQALSHEDIFSHSVQKDIDEQYFIESLIISL